MPGCPDVIAQLRSRLPGGWQATLLAVDGATVSGVERQLGGLPPDATHLVVSAGGNDALGASYILGERVVSVSDAAARLASAQQTFAAAYDRMLSAVQRRGRRLLIRDRIRLEAGPRQPLRERKLRPLICAIRLSFQYLNKC